MNYADVEYPVSYRKWLLDFIDEIKLFYHEHYNHIDIDSLDQRVFEVIIQLYKQLTTYKSAHVCLDLNEVKHPVCTLKVTKQEDNKELLIIKCTINNNLEKLKLYRFPNLTPCPRCEAFKHVLEEYLGDSV